MFGLFKKKPLVMTVTLNARLQPFDRHDIEDAFDATMASRGHAIRIIGGGTAMLPNGEASECDIEVQLDKPSEDLIDLVIGTFDAMLGVKGSRATIPGRDGPTPFGRLDGLALYLNGTDLPDAIYEATSAQHVYEECQSLLSGIGSVSSNWQGDTETAIYMYGPSFSAMRDAIADFVRNYPLCERARIEQIA